LDLVINVIIQVLQLYMWVIIARALFSWFPMRYGTLLFRVNRVLVALTEPYVGLFRRYLPLARLGGMGLDLSPLVALFVLLIVIRILARL
jgi:YggT family protein